MIYKHICVECKEEFVGRKNQRACSTSCRSQYYHRHLEPKIIECNYCGQIFQRKNPRKNSEGKLACKECKYKFHNTKWSKTQQEYAKSDKARLKNREYMLKARYGISLSQYDKLSLSQNHACAICKNPDSADNGRYLVIDHDHQTNKVRGLLCDKCNRALGSFNDDPQKLQNAILYLVRGKNLNSWDQYFVNLAMTVSTKSKDPSTQVGAVIVKNKRIISTGYNGFPPGIDDSQERLSNREIKYQYICHAEINALSQCSLHGVSCNGATIFTYPFGPCKDCIKSIIVSGIKRVVYPSASEELRARWGASLDFAAGLAQEAGLELVEL